MNRHVFMTAVVFTSLMALPIRGEFVHPGCLSTQADLNRMRDKVAAGDQPWKGSWDILVKNTDRWLDHRPEAVEAVRAGGGGENFMRLARDVHRAYQLALRYHGSGDTRFADKAVEILNAWADTHETWEGDTNVSLRKGIYGYQFACAAELLRDYSGWKKSDFSNFQKYMIEQFYSGNEYFLRTKHGTVADHYWSNWTQANVASMMAIGVLCDRQDFFDEGLSYFKGRKQPQHGSGTEFIERSIVFRHPNGLGQWQESGRDQGHSLMGPQLTGPICEIAWNQGIDLYGYKDNLFLSAVEYISKYNVGEEVPWVTYVYVHGHPGKEKHWVQRDISSHGRGQNRPGWDLVYNHYVNRLGLSVPWTRKYVEKNRPEGGGFNHGGTSGGFDGLGFTTLTHSLDPIRRGAEVGTLIPFIEGRKITLSWAGSAYAESYNVKRSTTSGGPYETLATVASDRLHYADMGLTPGQTYYYVVSANHRDGESADSAEAAAAADYRLQGEIIGTEGSYGNSGAGRQTVFDNSLQNYFDGPQGDAWAGLDLGPDVQAVITSVKYAPRDGYASRMVGGRFQGCNRNDFKSGVEDLFTISEQPSEGELTYQPINNKRAFRYVRYIGPSDGNGNVAEVQFYGETSSDAEPL